MIQAKCIQKFRDKHNNIYGYHLQDQQGNIKDVTPDQLKTAIQNQQITIINLTLTSDNRLVDTTPTQQPQISEEQIKSMIVKARILGILEEIPTACGHKCYLISQSGIQHIIYIPDDVTELNMASCVLTYTEHIQNLHGTLKIIGGNNLKNANSMFYDCRMHSLELSSFNTSKVVNMEHMFTQCRAESLDLSSFNTHKVTDMSCMFDDCQAQSIDLSSFNTSRVTHMDWMFYNCQAQSLDLSSFNTSKVCSMARMFQECQAQYIKLSSFNVINVINMYCMFHNCQAKSIDLSSFNISNVTNMEGMFYKCQAQIRATDPRILQAIQSR